MSNFLGDPNPLLSYDNSNFDSFHDLIKKAYKKGGIGITIRCKRRTAKWLEYVRGLHDDGGPDYVECHLSINDLELIEKMGEEVFGRWVK